MTDQTPHDGVPPEQGQPPASHGATVDGSGAHGEPMQPGGPVPPKKGLPRWALGLIIGGGVLIIAIIIGVIVVVSLFANAVKHENNSAPGSTPGSSEPELQPTPNDAPSNDSGEPSTGVDTVPLSGNASFANPPVWGAPHLSGWDITVLDQDGVNRFENRTLGCTFLTSQNIQKVVGTSANDAATTQDLIDTLQNQITNSVPSAEATSEGSVDLSLGVAGSSTTIEFATLRLDYSLPEGDFASVLFARSMPQSGSYMYTHLKCTRALVDSADSPLQELTDGLAVVLVP